MLANSQMIPNRYGRWCAARKRIAYIKQELSTGRTVYLCTSLSAIKCTAKHINMLKATKHGAFVQMGKRWDCIDYCAIRVQQ
jgi:hypothetical protein